MVKTPKFVVFKTDFAGNDFLEGNLSQAQGQGNFHFTHNSEKYKHSY